MSKLYKIISLILALTVFSSIFGTVTFAADNPTIYFNETFDNYITNDNPKNFKIEKGTDGRVVIRKEGTLQKAAYAKALMSPVLMTAPIGEHNEEFVVSAEIMLDGARAKGNVMALGGGTSFPLLKYDTSGAVLLGDNYRVGSYRLGEWKTYTFVISKTKQKFTLYIDDKPILKNWYFTSSITGETSLDFAISKPANAEYTELYVDNVRVYSGDKVMKDSYFPYVSGNSAQYPFSPTETIDIGNNVFLSTKGNSGFNPSTASKGGVTEFAPLDDEEELRLHMKCDAGVSLAGVFADIALGNTENVVHFVYEISVYPKSMSSASASVQIATLRNDTKSPSLMRLFGDGSIKYNNITLAKIPMKQWSDIALAVQLDTQTADVYVNGVLKSSAVPVSLDTPNKIRLSLVNDTYGKDVYFDNIRFYEGSVPRDITSEGGKSGSRIAKGDQAEDALKAMGNGSVAFMTAKDYVFYEGTKTPYSSFGAAPKFENDILYTDINTIKSLFKTDVTYSETNDTININGAQMSIGSKDVSLNGASFTLEAAPIAEDGTVYVPLASTAEIALKKFVYKDGRGWILVSNSNRNLSNSVDGSDTREASDIIDRYLQFDRPDGETLYNAIISTVGEKKHPRLFATDDQIELLRENIKTNDVMAKWSRVNIGGANALIGRGPLDLESEQYKDWIFGGFLGIRDNLYSYCTAYMITGDSKYAQGAWKELESVCNWKNWEALPNYLACHKLLSGIALAYDVFYNEYTEEQRSFIRKKTTEYLLNYVADAYAGENAHKDMLTNRSNWGSVCHGAILMWSLATMDEEPIDSEYTELAKFLGSSAIKGLEYNVSELYPSGIWPEGLGYFNYVVEYNAWAILSLTNACGTDYKFLSYPGLLETANYALYIQTPGHGYCNFGDGATLSEAIAVPPEIFLYAKLTNNQELNDIWYDFRFNMLGDGQKTLDILFYTPGSTSVSKDNFELDRYFGGVEAMVMKQNWNELSGTYVCSLAGDVNIDDHSHAGQFFFEALGERWSVDLGKDNYNIAGGYYGAKGLDLYRRRAEGHNTLVINPDSTTGQRIGSYGYVEKQESKPKAAYVIYNLDDCYLDYAASVKRGFYYGDDRNTLTVQDEFKLNKNNSDVFWFMHTKANIEVAADGKSAILTQNGQKLKIEFMSNLKEWHIEAREALPLPTTPVREGQGKNTGVTKVTLVGKGSGNAYITAKLIPLTSRKEYPGVSYIPMNEWTLPDGEIEPMMSVTEIMVNGEKLPGYDPLKTEYKYTTMDANVIPQVSATVTKGNLTITQAPVVGDYAYVTLTDGIETFTYRILIEEGIIDGFAQSDNAYKPAEGGIVATELTSNAFSTSNPANIRKLKIKGFYALDAQTGNAAEHIFDNDLTTRWASDVNGAYIVADLGETKKIDGVICAFYDGKSREYKFDIQVSNDNKNYTTVFSGYSFQADGYQSLMLNGVQGRYIRFVGYGHKAGEWNNMLEFAPFELK